MRTHTAWVWGLASRPLAQRDARKLVHPMSRVFPLAVIDDMFGSDSYAQSTYFLFLGQLPGCVCPAPVDLNCFTLPTATHTAKLQRICMSWGHVGMKQCLCTLLRPL